MTDTTYNGWSNYATWLVSLEITDDLISRLANDIKDGHANPFADVAEMVDHLREEVDQIISGYGDLDDDPSARLALSYARAFLADVNWHEIAESAAADNPELIRS